MAMQLSELGQALTRLAEARQGLEKSNADLEKAQRRLQETLSEDDDDVPVFFGTRDELVEGLEQEIEGLKKALQLTQGNFEKAQEGELSARLALEKDWDDAPPATKSPRGDGGWLQSTQVPGLLYYPAGELFSYPGRDGDRHVHWTRVEATVPDLEKRWNAAAAETKSTKDDVWYESTAVPGLRYCPAEYRFVAGSCQWTSILQRMRGS